MHTQQSVISHPCRLILFAALAVGVCLPMGLRAADDPWREEAEKAIGRGISFLVANQNDDGSFGERPHPGITALCVYALAQSPLADDGAIRTALMDGLRNLRTFVQEDGSLQPKRHGVPVYTTSVSLLAFDAVGLETDRDLIRNARGFLLDAQQAGEGPQGERQLGGFGYTTDSRPDMSNTQWAIDALHATREFAREPLAKDPQAAEKAQAAFDGALNFLKQCQNTDQDSDNYGGVSYLPQDHQPQGIGRKVVAVFRGKPPQNYGAMTYAAMKTMIYADVDRDDERVQSALRWMRHNFTFDENPGQGMQSYFYYIQTCAKSLAALGQPSITDADGETHDWRAELTKAMVDRQHDDGRWVNDVGRHWESDPHLVTAYTLLALEYALGTPAAK